MFKLGYWLNEHSRQFLANGYLRVNQSAEDRLKEMGQTAERILAKPGFRDKFFDYAMRGWYSFASPVWTNFGNQRGLPISCNGSYMDDTTESIFTKASEIGMMTKLGSGTSLYMGALRPRGSPISVGGTSDGPIHFAELPETVVNIISQGNVRRGSIAVYFDIDSKEIREFLEFREEHSKIKNMSLGVTIKDKWMEEMLAGDYDKRRTWARLIQKRFETGYPYIFFHDSVNNNTVDVYKDKKMTIWASNLCTEIALPSGPDLSFVCCLSSMNLLHYDEWKDTDAVEILTYFLDAVMTEYVRKTEGIKFMEDAHRFAKEHRAIGIGTLGWHSYLQSKGIAFESIMAQALNKVIHKNIRNAALNASVEMAKIYGEPEVLKGYGRRHTTLMAIAPTTSSSFILGQVSPSIEPLNSNYFIKDLAKGKFTYKNPYLTKVLEKYEKNTNAVWAEILQHGGSVQTLSFLTEDEKAVFKTFGEISQMSIIQQAVDRQKYVDQAQSINLTIHFDTHPKEVHELYVQAWKMGLKTLYYQRSSNPSQEMARNLLSCVVCEA